MGERSEQTIWNDSVEIGQTRKIAARGITRNHIQRQFSGAGVSGQIFYFEHFEKSTVVAVLEPGKRLLTEVDLDHLDEVEVEV